MREKTGLAAFAILEERVAKVFAKRAPKIGEHNEEILREPGFSATEIDALRANGAIAKAGLPAAELWGR